MGTKGRQQAKRPVSVLSVILLFIMALIIIFLVLMQNVESLKDYFGSTTFKVIFDGALVLCLALFAAYIFSRSVEYHRNLEEMVKKLERGNALLKALNDIQARATASLDAEGLLEEALDTVMPLLSSLGTIYLLDDENSLLVPRVSHGSDARLEDMPSFAIGEGIVGKVAASGAPLEDRGGGEGARGLFRYAVPIRAASKFMGVMLAGTTAGPYDEEAKTFLNAVSDVLGNALTNAKLYDLTRRALETTRRSQGYLEGFVSEAPMGIVLVDEKGAVMVANREALVMLGVRQGELQGRTVSELQMLAEGGLKELSRALNACISAGQCGRIALPDPGAGSHATVIADVFPLRHGKKEATGAAATLRRAGK